MNTKSIAYKVSINTIILNSILSLFKFLAGIIGKSQAMLSDAIHTLSDVLSTIIVMIGIKVSNKSSDASHQYGHERMECVASIILASLLFFTGILVGYKGIKSIFNPESITTPTLFALIMAIISILVKEAMYWYTRKNALKINSNALMADAWHHRSDAMSSIGSLIGVVGAIYGIGILDAVASLIICLFILKVSIDIFIDSINKMVDKSCDEKLIDKYKSVIESIDGVDSIDIIKSRLFGNMIYLDLEIGVDEDKPLKEAHLISHNVHDALENYDKNIKHCMIHVNPYKK